MQVKSYKAQNNGTSKMDKIVVNLTVTRFDFMILHSMYTWGRDIKV